MVLDNVIGVEEASERWGLSAGYIKNLCAEGKIKAKKIGKTWVIDGNQPNPSKRAKEPEYDEIKAKYQEFVDLFLSESPGTEKEELLPNLWSVTNKNHNFKATIECEYRIHDTRTMEKEWFAVVTELDEQGKEKDKSYFLLEFDTEK